MAYSVMMVDDKRCEFERMNEHVQKTDWLGEFIPVLDSKNAMESFNSACPDVAILSLMMSRVDGFGLCELIRSTEQGKDTVVVLYSPVITDFVVKKARECGADHIFMRPVGYDVFSSRLHELLENRGQTPDVSHVLFKMGISPRIRGYAFLKYAIPLTCEDKTLIKALTTRLYPMIAQKFNTSVACVERNIRHAVESAWIRGDMKYIDSMFGYTVDADKGKPTNAEFIAMLTDKFETKRNIID